MRQLLSIQNVTVVRAARRVVRSSTLHVHPGQIIKIRGPNGSGKSTLLEAVAGLHRLTSGRVMLAGRDISSLSVWARVQLGLCFLPQRPFFAGLLQAADNLRVYGHSMPRADISIGHALFGSQGGDRALLRQMSELIDRWVGEGTAGRPLDTFSGGERKILGMLAAYQRSSRVFLLDEPLAGVATQMAPRLIALIKELAQRGAGVVIVEHRPQGFVSEEVECRMEAGRLESATGR